MKNNFFRKFSAVFLSFFWRMAGEWTPICRETFLGSASFIFKCSGGSLSEHVALLSNVDLDSVFLFTFSITTSRFFFSAHSCVIKLIECACTFFFQYRYQFGKLFELRELCGKVNFVYRSNVPCIICCISD